MGIFGAMTTAITGLQAQAYALERISDNIANSQTTGYKRSDTSFVDFVADSPANQQALGVVNAYSRPTNTIQGDIANVQVPTYMAINGDGYFIVAKPTATIDGQPVLGGGDLYTRRGDFEFNNNGYLVNGAGYYLKGLPIDPATGNPIGGTPEVIRISNDFLPANATTSITYRANLASYPKTASADPTIPGSELIRPADFVDANPLTTGTVSANDSQTFISQSIAGGALTAYDTAGAAVPVQFRWAKTETVATAAFFQGTAVGNVNDLSAGIAGFNDGAAAEVTGAGASLDADAASMEVGTGAFDTSGGAGSFTINGETINFALNATLDDVRDEINLVMTGAGINITATHDGTDLTLTGNADTDIVLGGPDLADVGLDTTTSTARVNLLTQGAVNPGETLSIQIGANAPLEVVFGMDGGAGEVSTLAELQAALATLTGGTATIDPDGNISVEAANKTDGIDIGGTAYVGQFGLAPGTTNPTPAANDLLTISVNGIDYDFRIGTDAGEVNTLTGLVNAINNTTGLASQVSASSAGGALSIVGDNTSVAFTIGGDAAAVDGLGLTAGSVNPTAGGQDTWNLFYLTNSNATGAQTAWVNVGQDYVFGSNGRLNPPIAAVTINNLSVNGVGLGNIVLNHGTNGLTQFADENGVAKWNDLSQNGYAAGEFVGVSISREGRLVASYTNGRSLDVAEIALASFNGDNGLAKVDGGAFRATPESGEPIIGALGFVQGSALEGSNTDIADEFTKLIVTQQAYAANTRIISTSDEMIREALNMVR